jgi:hypothetical protein
MNPDYRLDIYTKEGTHFAYHSVKASDLKDLMKKYQNFNIDLKVNRYESKLIKKGKEWRFTKLPR